VIKFYTTRNLGEKNIRELKNRVINKENFRFFTSRKNSKKFRRNKWQKARNNNLSRVRKLLRKERI
jgi:hypothetical protein